MPFGRLERSRLPQPMGDINMTPLIDVMLVLLVIFMITAPLMSSSLRLDLPRSDAATPSDAPRSIDLAIDAQGGLFVAEQRIDEAELRSRLMQAAQGNPQLEVQLRADKAVSYGRVAEVLGWIQGAGLSRIGFVAEPSPTR